MRGLDRQLRVWLAGNVAGPLILYWFDTDLTKHLSGTIHTPRCFKESPHRDGLF